MIERCCATCANLDRNDNTCEEGGFSEIGDINRELTEEDCNAWESYGYAKAEAILDDWNYFDLPDGQEIIEAISKAKQAIRDCLEMGLNGEGD